MPVCLATILTVSAALAPAPSYAATADLSGHWEGEVVLQGRAMPVEWDVIGPARSHTGSVSLPSIGQFSLPIRGLRIEGNSFDMVFRLERDDVRWTGKVRENQCSGNWTGVGSLGQFELERLDAEPRLFTEQSISFRGKSGNRLGGTLILPPGPGPHAAAVWVHGTGFIGRKHRSYRMWGYLLSRHGVACLLYDKRGVGASTGSFQSASLSELTDDALAAAEVLFTHPLIDSSRVGIGGFSQGGMIAPMAMTRDKQLSFLIAISAPGISPMEQTDYAVVQRLRARGFDEDVVNTAQALRRRLTDFARFGTGREALSSQLKLHALAPWFSLARLPAASIDTYRAATPDWVFLEPLAFWRRVTVPTLAIWGTEDRLVPSQLSFKLITKALETAGNNRFESTLIDRADHDLFLAPDARGSENQPVLAPNLEPIMAAWLAREVLSKSDSK